MGDESKVIQLKSVAVHTGSYSDYLQKNLGICDFNQGWNNFHLQMEACIKLIENILVASEPRIITDPRTGLKVNKNAIVDTVKHAELILDPLAVYQYMRIWYGGCFRVRYRNPTNPTQFLKDAMEFHYDEKKINYKDPHIDVMPYPALNSMWPTESTSKERWGVPIREGVPFRYSFDQCVYDTVIRDGKFYYLQGGKRIAKFKPEEMKSLTKKSYVVGKPFHYKVMNILKPLAIKKWSIISLDIHRIIEFFENGLDDEATTQHKTNSEWESV